MSKVKHTPTPWKGRYDFGRHWISAKRGRRDVQIVDVSDIEVPAGGEVDTDHEQTAANAAFIVRACNAYDNLVAACESVIEAYHSPVPPDPRNVVALLSAAIRKAKG